MDPVPRHRPPFGIFEAALVLVLAGAAVWLARPVPGARAAAAAEKEVLALLDAVADAEDALPAGAPFLPLPALAARGGPGTAPLALLSPSPVEGVMGNGSYWVAVLLPDRDGVLRGPGERGIPGARRGYAVVAWPRKGASPLLRSVAALPRGGAWQRADGMPESGEPGGPPVPSAAFSADPEDPPPEPPTDWVRARDRKGGEGEGG